MTPNYEAGVAPKRLNYPGAVKAKRGEYSSKTAPLLSVEDIKRLLESGLNEHLQV